MSTSDARSQDPWTDPQTHLDTDPVNAEPPADEPEADAHPGAYSEADPDPEDGS